MFPPQGSQSRPSARASSACRSSGRPSSLSRSASSPRPPLISVPLPLSSGSPTRALVGLRNFGNTCYCNAPLQVLLSCEAFCLYFLTRLNPRKDVNPLSRYRGRLLEAWLTLLRQIYGDCAGAEPAAPKSPDGEKGHGHSLSAASSSSPTSSRYSRHLSQRSAYNSSSQDSGSGSGSPTSAPSRLLADGVEAGGVGGGRTSSSSSSSSSRAALFGGHGSASTSSPALTAGASRSCQRLLELVRHQHAQFAEFQQCDAHEFLRTFLDDLSMECNRAGRKQFAAPSAANCLRAGGEAATGGAGGGPGGQEEEEEAAGGGGAFPRAGTRSKTSRAKIPR
ncbi:ubiquitin carboxyl-terminal hydrolase [Besnoitia besnoiti]|uniref:Ubiquitin carboxyl-terminal hydrolase n=1 Tax=Besnoitia besnoiti TaxID=94643 RepID=A0A2A9MI01_BESBE|nr:ubiquitin carboxyl-terminal hydrolase [Besnoitia besnoiti]PFH35881.1 ubiquitin carboxyl-terminal hydrolase [Besnoitia besnoiti]